MILNTLKEELQQKSQKRNEPIRNTFILSISGVALFLGAIYGSYIYFYTNYILYSFGILFVLCLVICLIVFRSRKSIESIDPMVICISVLIFVSMLSIWWIPKLFHYTLLDRTELCINAKLISKYRLKSIRNIRFEINSTKTELPATLLKIDTLSNIDVIEYDKLPPIGSKIQICGQLSKVGFSYEYIDTVP